MSFCGVTVTANKLANLPIVQFNGPGDTDSVDISSAVVVAVGRGVKTLRALQPMAS